MKKLHFALVLTLLFSGFAFTSCGDDDEPEKKDVSLAEQYIGTYTAIDSLNVNGSTDASWNAKSDNAVQYVVRANTDNTISVDVPAETYKGINMVGDITLSKYTISNIAWNDSLKAFHRNYSNDGLSLHFTSSTMHLDSDYQLNNPVCEITISRANDGKLVVKNVFRMGRMPVTINTFFNGVKQ